MDVEAGIKEQEMVLLSDELKGCGCGELDDVAVMGFEIKDVVCSLGYPKSISPLASLECVVAELIAEVVMA